MCGEVGYPTSIRTEQNSEFVSCDLDLWAWTRDVILDFSRPGTPNQCWFVGLDAVRKCEV